MLTALTVIFLLFVQIGAAGLWLLRFSGSLFNSLLSRLPVALGCGFVFLGAEMFVLGYVNAWNHQVLTILSLLALVSLIPWLPCIVMIREKAMEQIRLLTPLGWLALATATVLYLIVLWQGLRPPHAVDELGYHWAAPMFWAQSGHWLAAPFKLVNGFSLQELLYLFSAIYGSATAAHWTHSLFLLLLCFSAAALSGVIGGNRLAAVLVVLSSPVIVVQAPLAYNDLSAAVLALTAFVPLFCVPESDQDIPAGNLFLAGMLFAGAIFTKPILAAAVPAALIYVWKVRQPQLLAARFSAMALLLLCPLVCAPIWLLHTQALTGSFTDPTAKPYFARTAADVRWDKAIYVAADNADPVLTSGAAAGRIPQLRDILVLPVVPLLTPVIGQQEPYGGRTGLALMPFALVAVVGLILKRAACRSRVWTLLGAAAFYFLSVGLIFIKTRFHIFVWSGLACMAGLGYAILAQLHDVRQRAAALTIFFLLVWLGMADSIHSLIK